MHRLIAWCSALAVSSASATQAAETPPPPPAAQAPEPHDAPPAPPEFIPAPEAVPPVPPMDVDTVYLRDGTVLQGHVMRQVPGKYVMLQELDGRRISINWSEVTRVELAPDEAYGRAEEDRRGEYAMPQGPIPNLAPRPNWFLNFGVGAGFIYGHADLPQGVQDDMAGGGIELSLRYLVGNHFPEPQGGNMYALSLEPTLGVYGAGVVRSYIDGNTGNVGALLARAGLQIAFEHLWMGHIWRDLHQRGFGAQVGYYVGYQYSHAPGLFDTHSELTHGPNVALIFPEYNAVTGKLTRGFIRLSLNFTPGYYSYSILSGGAAF